MSDYQNADFRLVDGGISVQISQDLLGPGQWYKFNNASYVQEGFISSRFGLDLFLDLDTLESVNTLKRLDISTIISGAGPLMFRNSTAFDSTFSENRKGIVFYKKEGFSDTIAYVGDLLNPGGSVGVMRKLFPDGTDWGWGITKPLVPLIAVSGGAGALSSAVSGGLAYEWFYTYGNSRTGAESNPSDPPEAGLSLNMEKALITVYASDDPQVDQIKLYRKGGTLSKAWRAKTLTNSDQQIEDNTPDTDLLDLAAELTYDNYVPFTLVDNDGNFSENSTPFIFGPYNGNIILAVGIYGMGNYVVWTNPGRPDSADTSNKAEVSSPNDPLMNGCLYQGSPFVASRLNWWVLDFSTSDIGQDLTSTGPSVTFQPRLTPIGKGLASRWGFCTGPLIWFFSDDGIYETDGQSPARSITESTLGPIFVGQDIGTIRAVDYTKPINMEFSGREVNFWYTSLSQGTPQWLAYDIIGQRWRSRSSSLGSALIGVNDVQEGSQPQMLVGFTQGFVCRTLLGSFVDFDGVTSFQYETSIESGLVDLKQPNTLKEWGGLIVDLDPLSTSVTVQFLNENDLVIGSSTFAGGVRRKEFISLGDSFSYRCKLKVSWLGEARVYQICALWRPDEEEVKHWAHPPTSLGYEQAFHLRNIYLALASQGSVTLTVKTFMDGTTFTDTYSLASTGGTRKRTLQHLKPRKGTLFSFALDSTAVFKLYGGDCSLHAKPWGSGDPYNPHHPFGQSGAA